MFGIGVGVLGSSRGALGRFVLSQIGAATAFAASPRKLRDGYSGPAMRVRRSSDNAELDIGFTAAGDLDEAALLAFVGSFSGFVTRMYDQSGNARDLAQATAANQPRIVFAGVIDRVIVAENLLKHSEDFSSTAWSKQNVFVTAGISDPLGGVSAYTVTALATAARQLKQVLSAGSSGLYANSIWMRRRVGVGNINLWSPDGAVPNIISGMSTTWTRYTAPNSSVSTNRAWLVEIVAEGDSIDIWGAQLNTGSTARTYCRTDATPVALGDAHPLNKPGYRTDGVSQSMATGSFAVPQPFTRSSVLQFLNVTAGTRILGDPSDQDVLYFYSNGDLTSYAQGSSIVKSTKTAVNDTATVAEIHNGSSSSLTYNGTVTSGSTASAAVSGVSAGKTGASFGSAIFSDTIIFPQALSTADRIALEKSQRDYFGTP